MGNQQYSISYGPPLTVKDQPHRELSAIRGDYGLPSPDRSNDDVSFSEEKTLDNWVEISQPIIQEAEISCIS
jgi:hypothetical protein